MLCTALALLGQSPDAQARVDAATAQLRNAVALAPRDAAAYRALANAYIEHKFLRAAGSTLATALSLAPADPDGWRELGGISLRTRDVDTANHAYTRAAELLPTSGQVQMEWARAASNQEPMLRRAIELEPQLSAAYLTLSRWLKRQKRDGEAEATLRSLVAVDSAVGTPKLYEHLYFASRKLEAAMTYKRASLLNGTASALDEKQADWKQWVDGLTTSAPHAKAKCLERQCIQGLEEALERVKDRPRARALEPPHRSATVLDMLRGDPVPTVLRRAGEGFGPTLKWNAEHLQERAGEEPLDITVVTVAGAFEVRPDRIERPAKSTMRLGDFTRLLSLRNAERGWVDANLTLYSRQASLWPMAGLLHDLKPLPWMESLRLNDLNIWLGDGHFRNTLHFDPYDNFLCQIRGAKRVWPSLDPRTSGFPSLLPCCLPANPDVHGSIRVPADLLLYPPSQQDNLYYGSRRDIQANYLPSRGEYGRHDTGIVSTNTAEINGAAPDLAAFPKYAKAREVESYAMVEESDCLYLPNGWHHHVFSEADPVGGYNLALNIWVDRQSTTSGKPPNPNPGAERFPTLGQLQRALDEADEADSVPPRDEPPPSKPAAKQSTAQAPPPFKKTPEPAPCVDEDPASCAEWAAAGECKNNPGFMLDVCKLSCKACEGDLVAPAPPPFVKKAAVVKKAPVVKETADDLGSCVSDDG